MPKTTRADIRHLETVAWGTEQFGSVLTNRQFPRSAALKLVAKGLARSAGLVEQCDGDGGIIAGRALREGFTLTQDGLTLLREKFPAEYNRLTIRAVEAPR